MKPLMYGYMRVADDATDDEVEAIRQQMERFAEAEGFCYTTTFYEYVPGSQGAFVELIEELKRAEARHVAVPTLDHLSAHPLLCRHMVERLEVDASARVWTLEGGAPDGGDDYPLRLCAEGDADQADAGHG